MSLDSPASAGVMLNPSKFAFFCIFFFNRFQLLIAIRTMESDAEMGMA